MDVTREHNGVTQVNARLGFSRPAEVTEDHEGRGLKRAITRPIDCSFERQFEYHHCTVRDWSAPGQAAPGLQTPRRSWRCQMEPTALRWHSSVDPPLRAWLLRLLLRAL